MTQWESDVSSPYCRRCNKPWNALFRWKHHCRKCGQLVCSECIDNTAHLVFLGNTKICRPCKSLELAIEAAELDALTLRKPNEKKKTKDKLKGNSPYLSLKEIAQQALLSSRSTRTVETADCSSPSLSTVTCLPAGDSEKLFETGSNSFDLNYTVNCGGILGNKSALEAYEATENPPRSKRELVQSHFLDSAARLASPEEIHTRTEQRNTELQMRTPLQGTQEQSRPVSASASASASTTLISAESNNAPITTPSQRHRLRGPHSHRKSRESKHKSRSLLPAGRSPLVFLHAYCAANPHPTLSPGPTSYTAADLEKGEKQMKEETIETTMEESRGKSDHPELIELTPKARQVIAIIDELDDQQMERLFRKLGALMTHQKKWYPEEEPGRCLHEILIREKQFFSVDNGNMFLNL